ncbi:hypothetical protein MOV08_24435 [Streptomyces yunnanensis]|uniref:BON domain-containing protein n=1 Tax=Streptomyces yunnanensis TaxID=156453 RepID=A0ABY8ACT8_9ACTN|nr:hypothetical protein [Streptomyces yunnanensis]WEB42096.1 hypothetical protein MOV08_24435 [Streptomyces yunnanensis]
MTSHGTHRATDARRVQDAVDAACDPLRHALADMGLHLPDLTVTVDRNRVVLGTISPGTAERMTRVLKRAARGRRWMNGDGWVVGGLLALTLGAAVAAVVFLLLAR